MPERSSSAVETPSPTDGEETIDPAIVQQAAQWMARLWSDNASENDKTACARWRAENPHHELAWKRLEAFEEKFQHVPHEVAQQTLLEPSRTTFLTRRRALGALAAIAGVTYVVRGTDLWQTVTSDYHTGTGETREVVLPDGTHVILASASAINLRFNEQERLLVLRSGEILVTTASDPAPTHRPFRVQGRDGIIEALGTRFTLRQDDTTAHVAVFEGIVQITPRSAPDNALQIHAGQKATFTADKVHPPVSVADNALSWVSGTLVADNMRLDELVAELARYRRGWLRCDPAVADLKVTGIFSLRDTDRALHNLELALPVKVTSRMGYWVTVKPAD